MFWSIIGRILKILCYPHTNSLLQLVLKSGFSGRRLISLSDSLLIITFRRDNSLIEFSIAVEIQIQWFQWLPLDFLSAISTSHQNSMVSMVLWQPGTFFANIFFTAKALYFCFLLSNVSFVTKQRLESVKLNPS